MQRIPEMDVLVIDVGGSHVKLRVSGSEEGARFDSSADLTPEDLVETVRDLIRGWHYDVISLGYPGAVDARGPRAEPGNLGNGWVSFDFEHAFGKPVRVINDAVMQALGGYDGGRMLFLGLGTGLGSTLITERVVIPLELGCLPFSDTETMAERLGRQGRELHGQAIWLQSVRKVTAVLRESLAADYIVLGGGNSENVHPLPPGTRRGGNDDAFTGGFRLWDEVVEPHDQQPSFAWRVVR